MRQTRRALAGQHADGVCTLHPGKSSVDNAVTIARFEPPVAQSNPIEVMEEVGRTVARWRKKNLRWPASDQLAGTLPTHPARIDLGWRRPATRPPPMSPGSRARVVGGPRVSRMYPLVATIGAAVNVTMLTYDGVASIGRKLRRRSRGRSGGDHPLSAYGLPNSGGKPVATGTPLTRRRTSSPGAARRNPAGGRHRG